MRHPLKMSLAARVLAEGGRATAGRARAWPARRSPLPSPPRVPDFHPAPFRSRRRSRAYVRPLDPRGRRVERRQQGPHLPHLEEIPQEAVMRVTVGLELDSHVALLECLLANTFPSFRV